MEEGFNMQFTPTKIKEVVCNQSQLDGTLEQLLLEVKQRLLEDLVSLRQCKAIDATMGICRQKIAQGVSLTDAIDRYLQMVVSSTDLTAPMADLQDKDWLYNVVFTPVNEDASENFIGYTMNYGQEVKKAVQMVEPLKTAIRLGESSKSLTDQLKSFVSSINEMTPLQQYFILHHIK